VRAFARVDECDARSRLIKSIDAAHSFVPLGARRVATARSDDRTRGASFALFARRERRAI